MEPEKIESARRSPPASLEDYNQRFYENQRVSGQGLETRTHIPCPFCASEDFLSPRILDTESAMERGATCSVCGRSARAIFTRSPGTVSFEIVQTGGEDQPDWLKPKMRRVAVDPVT